MSHGPLDRSRFEAIEAYVLGTMPADERERFEQNVAGDPELRAELESQRENIQAVELGGLTRMLRTVAAEGGGNTQGGTIHGWSKYLKYAAVIAIVAAGAIWWLDRMPVNERLYAEYFVADAGLPVAMGATRDPRFDDAMTAYKLGDFAEARAKWTDLLNQRPSSDTLRFYVASAALGSGDAGAAIPLFNMLSEETGSAFHEKARWYLFLAYLRAGELERLDAIGLYDDPTYGERARAIKARLDP